jgi:hypothetical protein
MPWPDSRSCRSMVKCRAISVGFAPTLYGAPQRSWIKVFSVDSSTYIQSMEQKSSICALYLRFSENSIELRLRRPGVDW